MLLCLSVQVPNGHFPPFPLLRGSPIYFCVVKQRVLLLIQVSVTINLLRVRHETAAPFPIPFHFRHVRPGRYQKCPTRNSARVQTVVSPAQHGPVTYCFLESIVRAKCHFSKIYLQLTRTPDMVYRSVCCRNTYDFKRSIQCGQFQYLEKQDIKNYTKLN